METTWLQFLIESVKHQNEAQDFQHVIDSVSLFIHYSRSWTELRAHRNVLTRKPHVKYLGMLVFVLLQAQDQLIVCVFLEYLYRYHISFHDLMVVRTVLWQIEAGLKDQNPLTEQKITASKEFK